METIQLTQGQVAIVDDEDYEALSSVKWCADRARTKHCAAFYAIRVLPRIAGVRAKEYMHRVVLTRVLGRPIADGYDCDHVNGNRLDNRRNNLREVTRRVNISNLHIKKSSQYIGVSWYKTTNRWKSCVDAFGKKVHIGYYATELEAALGYDAYVSVYPELGAVTNFSERRPQ